MPSDWTYEQALAWLYDRQRLGIKLGLEKVHRLLADLGDPHRRFKIVHVAGTNGKGSVARLMAATLSRSGFHVGLTTSPHLISFCERIEVDGAPVARADVARRLSDVREVVARLDAEGSHVTFFEAVTALAFCLFADAQVDWAVVETGMGGRLDATNVVAPALTMITNVERDHAAYLGDTVEAIAAEKAGIMKPGVPCVTAAVGAPLKVIKERSRAVQAPMSVLGEDYQLVPRHGRLVLARPGGESHFDVGLAGEHQATNAALVVAGVEALRRQGIDIPEKALREALADTRHPGRLEPFVVTKEGRPVEVLLDGAHNVAAAHALRRHLALMGWSGFHLVVGFCADKDWRDVLEQWTPLAAKVWAVPLRNPRGLAPLEIEGELARNIVPCEASKDVAHAIDAAISDGAERILVAGSLYLVGEARAGLLGAPLEEIRGSQ